MSTRMIERLDEWQVEQHRHPYKIRGDGCEFLWPEFDTHCQFAGRSILIRVSPCDAALDVIKKFQEWYRRKMDETLEVTCSVFDGTPITFYMQPDTGASFHNGDVHLDVRRV